MKLTGVGLKMSSAYHPETNGSNECTNKPVNQAIHFHVDQNQKGWVWALPHIHFCMMNTVNSSTCYSGFQLHLGWCPCVIPPIIPTSLPDNLHSAGPAAENMITLTNDIVDMKDNLLQAKIIQVVYANRSCGCEVIYQLVTKWCWVPSTDIEIINVKRMIMLLNLFPDGMGLTQSSKLIQKLPHTPSIMIVFTHTMHLCRNIKGVAKLGNTSVWHTATKLSGIGANE